MVSADVTFTNNVNLEPAGARVSDWVFQLTPTVRFDETGARTRLVGAISVPILEYVRTSENNYVAPEANVAGTFEAIPQFFFIDASAIVLQEYLSPFGARPSSLVNATENRFTSQTYTVSPYIKGQAPNDIDYELRQRSIWSDANPSNVATSQSYTNEVQAHVGRSPVPVGWSLEYDRSDIKFEDEATERMEISRAHGVYRVDPTLNLFATIGYEDNQFFHTREHGATYGVGMTWLPSDRTRLDAAWEHRFFGSSYHVTFDHRTPLTVWSLAASRDITSYPEQIASLPPGGNVGALLNSLFRSRLPDAVQRQTFVDQFIAQRGLPSELTGPVNLFTQRITLVEAETATFGLIGARNTVFFTAFRSRYEPVDDAQNTDLLPILAQLTQSTQYGASAVWTHRLTQLANLQTTASWWRSKEREPGNTVTDSYSLESFVTTPLSARTNVRAGARFQDGRSNVPGGDYTEFAVFAGITHTFR